MVGNISGQRGRRKQTSCRVSFGYRSSAGSSSSRFHEEGDRGRRIKERSRACLVRPLQSFCTMSELLHRRATSNKVAASRERRVKRLNDGSRRKSGLGHRQQSNGRNRLVGAIVIAAALAGIALVSLWVRALVHVSTTEDPSDKNHDTRDGRDTKGIVAHVRGGDTSSSGNESPYTPEALKQNPWLGWQPKASHPLQNGKTFSVRECFKNDPKTPASKQPHGCSERPDELGPAPPVEKDWVPDVTMIRKMLMYGKDVDGQAFPPPLAGEFCENIGVQGGRSGDTNKECVLESMIRATGPLNSTTVTIHPSNHYGARGENAADEGVTVRAPRLMCLVYTMADAVRSVLDSACLSCALL